MTGWVLLAGLGTGLGLWLIVVGLFPRPPRLEKILDPPETPSVDSDSPPAGWAGRWGRPAAARLSRLGLPGARTRQDLACVDKPVEVHLAEQATSAVFGLLLVPLTTLLLALVGLRLGFAIPVVATLLGAVGGFFLPDLAVHSEAVKHRTAFRDALSSFLDLVVIGLASGAGVDQALDEAAKVGSGPAYAELRYALAEARLARVPPWDILGALGRRLGLAELQQLAATVGLAGSEGAKVRASLRSRALALRQRQLTEAEGEANAATERMSLPIVALFAGFLIFLGYPAMAGVLGGM
ncbi:MAG: type II secretion system F family protein [Micromonosporaceae bacterium]|nr:type II secretion system F family protein [Micromonosporaceae bacterium]